MKALVSGLERWQIPLYLAAIVIAIAVGLAAPELGHPLELAINPSLGLLLFVTFLGVPFAAIGTAIRDLRFLGTVLVLNFAVVPLVVWVLSRFVATEAALLLGVLFVLLTPCVDYVIVFSGLAGGDSARLLAVAPLLMIGQMLLLPVYLLLLVGPETAGLIEIGPFVEAFLLLIVLPLGAAAATQWLATRFRTGKVVMNLGLGLMIPLMMITLAVVVASQIARVRDELGSLAIVVPLFVAFLVVMVPLGMLASRIARLEVAARRAVVFSGATRNSLVVLPLALALPESLSLAGIVVVTQTLVELIGMVVFVRAIPRLIATDPKKDARWSHTAQ